MLPGIMQSFQINRNGNGKIQLLRSHVGIVPETTRTEYESQGAFGG
jgi:hypothetical protein